MFPTKVLAQTGSFRGTVTDPSGAVIRSAVVSLSNNEGLSRSTVSGRDGTFAFNHLVPGRYSMSISAESFAPSVPQEVLIYSGKLTVQNIALKLPIKNQQITVNDQGLSLDNSAENNASAIVIKGKDLDALSDDPDELQNELNVLAGPAAGPNGGQIYIDGFTGGQLPPKSSIREIRIN